MSKFSRYGRRWREASKEPEPPPVPTPTPPPHKTGIAPPILPKAPDIAETVDPIVSKLPDLAGGTAGSSSSNSNSNSSSDNGMSRLGGPKQPADEAKEAKARQVKKQDDDDAGESKPAGRGLGRRIVGELLPQPGTFKPNEVLAINPRPESLRRAVERGFIVRDTIALPALGLRITRLETPSMLNAVIGRSTLHEDLPDEGFGLNRIYAAGRTTTANAAGVAIGGGGLRRGTGCTPDRCFGTSLINWQPQLAACAQGVRIGVIDTGIDKSHPTFAGVRFEHRDFVPRNAKRPSSQHGTGIFSLLAGNPNSTTPGLVPGATFLVGDAFFADRNGNAMSDTVTMLRALNWLKSAGVDVANLSFAGPEDELVHAAIRDLAGSGTVILAAAGNEGHNAPPSYPAAYEEVIAVTAVDRNLSPYMYANRGSYIDVAAPGVDVWTALPGSREGPQTGTSFAVPFVTSVIALSYPSPEARTAGNPLAPKQRALALLQKNIKALGGRGRTPIFGAGLVQAPRHCDPRTPGAVASVAPPQAGGWTGTVKTAPAALPRPASWAGTVRAVAGRR
jgi:hypothetical protein